jgi:phage shock protein PspC (stress-responsive transcriptional regulator)
MKRDGAGIYIECMDELVESSEPLGPESDEAASTTKPEPSLRRSSTQKIFGGVAGGLAERFDVNANVVRVVFVVLSVVYGLGIAIYLAMWALIPRSASDVASEPSEIDDPNRVKWLRYAIPLGVVVLAVILIATLRNLPALGVSFWIVWLVFLVVMAVVSLFAPAHRLTIRRLIALAFLAALSFVIFFSGVFLVVVHQLGVPLEGGSGEKQWAPTSLAEVQRDYHGAIGASNIDFSRVTFSGTTYVTATQGVGQLTIDIPAGVKLDLKTHAGLGDVVNYPVAYYLNQPPAAQVKGATLVLNAEVGIGQIQIQRITSTQN